MDLLGGYGSGSDSEPGSPSAGGAQGRVTRLANSAPEPQATPAARQQVADPSRLLTTLPAPSGSKVPLFSGLPKPATKKRVTVQFRMPISYDPADVKIDPDEEPARKRAKASNRGRSLSELLPAPKNAPTGGGRKLDLLGGGKAAGGGRGRAYDSDEDEIVPGTEDRSGMVELRAGEAAADDNEAFRVDAAAAAAYQQPGAPAAAAQYDQQQQAQYEQWAAYYQQHGGHEYNQHQQQAAAAAAAAAVDPAEAMLQAALAAEREKAARRGQAVQGIQFKEVSGEAIRAMAPGQAAEVNALRNAFGSDYEAKLRQEAGSDPTKLAKRRHQIGSLYHYAKQKELEQMEVRAQGSKSKAETKKKYGW
ncbi:proline-rich PRCC [Chlorella sorokiniana]|uniref:Proline-rich PRCC n=1 Tax=Chlorella sorokiniana TaxID=3076 RepID=A0A2P6TI58_CHLSO|nr:proline-rich PRCC [Chlorella sorokiniana]|eukprot:PRW33970.1 proline-rich PRCC [Chlorella sorokiniana]